MVNQTAKQTHTAAREAVRSRQSLGVGMCLMRQRMLLGIDARYPSAIAAWDAAEHRQSFESWADVPWMAPVFSTYSGSKYGHVMMAGGRARDGERLLYTTDQYGDGRITRVRASFITGTWGHRILGWTRDLNGVTIPYLRRG
jgi:hypothetical protein